MNFGYDHDGGWMNTQMGGGGDWFLMGIGLSLCVVILVVLLAWILRTTPVLSRSGVRSSTRSATATTILEERFARGEIDEQEYLQRAHILRGAGSGS